MVLKCRILHKGAGGISCFVFPVCPACSGEDFQAYQWIMQNGGLAKASDYGPYLMADGFCKANVTRSSVTITGYVNVTSGSEVCRHRPARATRLLLILYLPKFPLAKAVAGFIPRVCNALDV